MTIPRPTRFLYFVRLEMCLALHEERNDGRECDWGRQARLSSHPLVSILVQRLS
jgi:hypothetical protein